MVATAPNTMQQQLEVFSGNPVGQIINSPNSYASLALDGTSFTVQVSLAQTNHPGASFQLYYKLDGGAPVATGVIFTTDSNGNGTASFTIPVIQAGSHSLGIDVNNTPAPGSTYYITASDISFTIPGQQLKVFSGNPAGQTIHNQGSCAYLTSDDGSVTAEVSIVQTNQPGASFQLYYKLDGGAPVATGVIFTTDSNGNGTASFTIDDVPGGSHSLGIDVNNTPAPGSTYYITASDIPFNITVGQTL